MTFKTFERVSCFLFCFFNRIAEIIRLLWLVPSGRSSNPVFVSSLEYSSDNVNIASYMMNIWWILSFHCLRGCQTHKSEHFGTLAHWQVSELYYLCIASILCFVLHGKEFFWLNFLIFDMQLMFHCVIRFSSNAACFGTTFLPCLYWFFITEKNQHYFKAFFTSCLVLNFC